VRLIITRLLLCLLAAHLRLSNLMPQDAPKPKVDLMQEVQEPKPKPKPKPKPSNFNRAKTIKLLKKQEGFNPTIDEITVGHGHDLSPAGKEFFAKALPKVNLKDVIAGKRAITKEEANTLLEWDLDNVHLVRAKKLFPKLAEYPQELSEQLVSATYQGFFSSTHKAYKAFIGGDVEAFKKNILDRDDYRNARRDKMGGLIGRYQGYRDAMLRYMNRPEEPKPDPRPHKLPGETEDQYRMRMDKNVNARVDKFLREQPLSFSGQENKARDRILGVRKTDEK